MGLQLSEIVPWGRSFDEYVAMFSLSNRDLSRRIVGCGDGPAAFNSELSARGGQVVSVDPLYGFDVQAISKRIDEVFDVILEQGKKCKDDFVWTHIQSVEHLCEIRMSAMRNFLIDYPTGRKAGRYVDAALPHLPFVDGEFDLALVSHLLFLYSEHMDTSFHIAALRELCRITQEVRVFPIMELNGQCSRHLDDVRYALEHDGYKTEVRRVEYEFQKNANEMLIISQ